MQGKAPEKTPSYFDGDTYIQHNTGIADGLSGLGAALGALAEHDIYGGVHYRDNTEYSMYTYAKGTCPKAHEMSEHLITLPLHMWLTDEEVQEIIKVVNDFVK